MPLEICYLDNEDGTHVLQIEGSGGDAPTVLGTVKSKILYFTTYSGVSYRLGQVCIGASQDSLTEFYADNSDAHIDLPDELVGVTPLYFAQSSNGTTATVVNELASSTPSSPGETISITSETPDASIYYTTDGSAPSVQSTLYEGQFEVTPPAMIKAKGYKTGMLSSDVAELEVTAPLEKLPTPVLLGFPESSGSFIDFLVELKVDGFENLENSNFMIKGGTHWNFDVVDSRSFENKGAGVYVINAPSDMYPEGTEFSVYVTADGYEDSDIMTFIYGIAPVTVPMALPDGSVLFYDRGESYGSYHLGDDGYPVREDSTTDDGSATSNNWRYLICDSENLSENRGWGPEGTNEGMTDAKYQDFGYGLPNTEALLSKYGGNSSYIWQLVQNKRNATGGKKWFVPSKDELNIVYQNRDTIVNAGGGSFPLNNYGYYNSSSENGSNTAWIHGFSNDHQNIGYKDVPRYCRLLRRV